MLTPGEKLITAAQAASRDVTLIAPFMKVDALTMILDNLRPEISVQVIARWHPAEIVIGVCDLEIFDVLATRPKARLHIHPRLHAKLYRFDDIVFFGSSNLTCKALGWTAPANIELLHAPNNMLSELKAFEDDLLSSAIPVDAEYRDVVRSQVENMTLAAIAGKDVLKIEKDGVESAWLPTCRTPHQLWAVYRDHDVARHRMVESAFHASLLDLEALDIAPGLPETRFNQHVAAMLMQMPLVKEIDVAARDGVTAADAVALIERVASETTFPYAPVEMWEILQAWLMHFSPDRYRREAATEIFRQGRVIG